MGCSYNRTIKTKGSKAGHHSRRHNTTSEDTTTINIDSDSLPDPFAPKETTPKMLGTKEKVQKIFRKKWTQCWSSSQMMTTMPHRKASTPRPNWNSKNITSPAKEIYYKEATPMATPQITCHLCQNLVVIICTLQ